MNYIDDNIIYLINLIEPGLCKHEAYKNNK